MLAASRLRKSGKVITEEDLLAGSMLLGWLGLLPTSEVGTASEIAAACDITAGTVINQNTQWMGFTHKGNVLYIPQKPIRNNVSWNQLNDAGLIFGKTVSINGVSYTARVFSETENEWLDLMRRVSSGGISSGRWASYSDAVLVLSGDLPGQNSMTQQHSGTTYLGRGSQGVNFSENLSKAGATTFRGWRPVLQLIG